MLTRHLVAVTLLSLMALTSAQTNIGTGGAFLAGLALPFIFNQFRRQPLPVVYPYPIQTNFQPNFFNPYPRPFFPGFRPVFPGPFG